MKISQLFATTLVASTASLAASAGTVSVSTSYGFDLVQVDAQFVQPQNTYPGVDGYFAGSQDLSLAGFTTATGFSFDRLESVTLHLDGHIFTIGSGGVYAQTGIFVDGAWLGLTDNDEYATERNHPDLRGIDVENLGSVSNTLNLGVFASDNVTLGIYSAIAFYGSLGQVDHGNRGFFSSGIATLDYNFSEAPIMAAVPTPSAALAGLLGLGGVALRRRKKA